MIRSVRFSLTIWYISILAVILIVFGILLYTSVRGNLQHTIDALLVAQANGIEDSIYSFWKAASKTSPSGEEANRRFDEEVASGRFSGLVRRWAEETDELDTSPPVRILSREFTPLAFSQSFADWVIPVNATLLKKTTRWKRGLLGTYLLTNDKRVRLLTLPIMEKGKILYYVQAATSLHQADVSLERLRTWLISLIPLTLFVTSLIGWFLASLILKPIGKMTLQAHEISESRLGQRIDVPKTGDELQRLALTFNEMLDRFEKGFKRLRQFSAAASHELRTPLTVMKGEMELALLKPRSEEDYRRVLENQLNVVNDMVHVVEQLLSVAHAEDGELAVRWETLTLEDLVRSTVSGHKTMATSKSIELQVLILSSARIKGERSLVERLISNLLENAIKHTPPLGTITLEVNRLEDRAQLTVTDTGKGIKTEEMPKIFDKFFNRTISAEGIQSTGIGLGLCRWIVELHKGTIEIENIPGTGAQFRVLFPAQ